MKYFDTLPRIVQTDINGNQILVNNILTRAYVLPKLANNINLFYKYDIKQGDTPDNLAYRYYNSVDRYWLLMYANNLMDPLLNWPIDDDILDKSLITKYKQDTANSLHISVDTVKDYQVMAYMNSTAHHYEQTMTTSNSIGDSVMSITVEIDKNTYLQRPEDYGKPAIESRTVSFPDGSTVTRTISKKAVNIYDYEHETNDKKRNINLIRDVYATDCERELKNLMSQ